MRKALSIFIAVCLVLSLFTGILAPVPSARALTSGDFTYSLAGIAPNQTATIMGYTGPGGVVAIPATLGTSPAYPVTTLGTNAFNSAQGHLLTSVIIPDSVTSIGSYAFYGCAGLTSVTVGSGVVTVGDHAFQNCTALVGIVIPNSVTHIGSNAFQGCTALASVTIPDGVGSIEDYAFYNCPALTDMVIPDSVESIGYWAFRSCMGLLSVTIGSGVSAIEDHAFQWCTKLEAAYFLGNAPTMGADVFAFCAPGFTVWYLCGKTGWTNPWYEYPTANNCSAATDLVLSASWNLVSLAVPLPVASIPGLQAVYGYHDGWSAPTTLLPGEAYWVQVQNAVTVPLPGTPLTTPVSITYQAGWQLLGNPFDVPLPIAGITNYGLITTCYSYGPAWGILNPATDSLQPGKGYWINLSAGTTLTLTHP